MYENSTIGTPFFLWRRCLKQLIMLKLMLLISLVFAFSANASLALAQKADLRVENTSLQEVFRLLKEQTDVDFLYTESQLKNAKPISIDVKQIELKEILEICLAGQDLTYILMGNTVLLKRENKVHQMERTAVEKQENTQQRGITGIVIDEKGFGLAGVSVKIRNTPQGTVTDKDGKYSIAINKENVVLIFSFIGSVTKEVSVDSQSTINIMLQSENMSLNEVVVTALGIKREVRSLTYSTQSVNTEQLTETREPNIMTALQGKVAGLSINESQSGVGADTRVVLRGDRSFAGDSQPLYVVDGVPIRGNPGQLNPDNIASINVLKGPSASALYGSAAQNGAIIITTHMGQADVVNISFNNTYMVQDPVMSYPFQNVYGQGNGGVYSKNSEFSWGSKMEGQQVDHWSPDPALSGTQYAFTPQPNNIKDYFQKGYNNSTNLTASIGGDRTQGIFVYTLTSAEGTISSNALKRHNVSLRINSKLTKRLSLDSKIEYMHQKYTGEISTLGYGGNIGQIYTVPRNIRTEHMERFEYLSPLSTTLQHYWNPGSTVNKNPYWTLHRNLNETLENRVIGMASVSYEFSEDLRFMVRSSFDETGGSNEEKIFNDNYNVGQFGYYSVGRDNGMIWTGDALLSYSKELNDKWSLNANVGGNIEQQRNSALSSNTDSRCCLIVPNLFTLSNTQNVISSNSIGSPMDIQSIYAFGNIGWKNALFLDFTGRNDWSSTLPAKSRSYFYPSLGVSAVLSDLIPSFPKLFSFAKVRASWAQVGNSTSPFRLDRYATFKGGGRDGFLQISGTLPNEDLRPESTEAFEAGLNVSFLKGRLGIDVTAYKTNTRDQLFTITLPIGSGATEYFTNGGDVENKGMEFLLTGAPIRTSALKWDINMNFAVNRNKVLAISDLREKIEVGNYTLEEGKPFGNINSIGFLRDEQGRVIVSNTGMPRFTSGKTVLVANYNPDWMGSIMNSFSYRNVSLSFLIDHRQGGTIQSSLLPILYYSGTLQQTLQGREGGLVFGENVFQHENAVMEDGSPNIHSLNAETLWVGLGSRTNLIGEAFIQDATNMRLRELSIGYSLPKSKLKKLPFSNVDFSIVGRNLFFIYRASKMLDADLMTGTGPGSLGTQASARPTSRTFGASLKVDF